MNATKNGMLKAAEQHGDEDSLVPPVQADRPSRRPTAIASVALQQSLADIKGQAQFLLYLADQIEDSLEQLDSEADACHSAFLCKVLGMYSGQLESKHQGLGEKIAEACQEVYVTVREREMI